MLKKSLIIFAVCANVALAAVSIGQSVTLTADNTDKIDGPQWLPEPACFGDEVCS